MLRRYFSAVLAEASAVKYSQKSNRSCSASGDQMTARLRLGIPPACPFDDVLYVELSAGPSIERSDTLRDIGPKTTELLDVGEQLTTNSLLNGRREPFDLGHCSFQRL